MNILTSLRFYGYLFSLFLFISSISSFPCLYSAFNLYRSKYIINKTATAPSNELAECVGLSNRCGWERRNGGLDCSQQIIIVTYPVDI